MDFLNTAPKLYVGVGIGETTGYSFWNTELCTLKNVSIKGETSEEPPVETKDVTIIVSGLDEGTTIAPTAIQIFKVTGEEVSSEPEKAEITKNVHFFFVKKQFFSLLNKHMKF